MSSQSPVESGLLGLDRDEQRAVWSTAYMNDLPDSAFLYIQPGGKKDADGKTVPRDLRHWPYKDAKGNIDLPHVRDALGRIPQTKGVPAAAKQAATKKAQAILADQNKTRQAFTATERRAATANVTAIEPDAARSLAGYFNARPDMLAQERQDHGSNPLTQPLAFWGAELAEPEHAGARQMVEANDGTMTMGAARRWQTETNAETEAMEHTAGQPELRVAHVPLTDIEVRDPSRNPDGTWTMSGYAAVFDQRTTLYDGRLERVTEEIDPGAFDRVLRSQGLRTAAGAVHFNYGHDMLSVVAATDVEPGQPGWLDLRADPRGLYYLAKVSQDDPDAHRMAAKMRHGVVKQASFAFVIAPNGSEWHDSLLGDGRSERHRRITEVGQLRDVCATAQGAYPQTLSQLRSYMAAIGQPVETAGAAHVNAPEGAGVIAVSPSGGGVASRRLNATQLRGVARHTRRRA